MNVGFRPRLKARPSLYDLIRDRNIERLSVRPSTPTRLTDLPPLPTSPKSSSTSVPPTPVQEKQIELVQEAVKMAPKKVALDADGEEQFGMFKQRAIQQRPPG